jgi:hypothetical protein
MNVRRMLSEHAPPRMLEIDAQIESCIALLQQLTQERQELSMHMILHRISPEVPR